MNPETARKLGQTAKPVQIPAPPQSGVGSFWRSLRYAWSGLLHAATQRNMKIHLVASILVALVGSGLRLGLAEKVTLIFCVMLVLFAEILNTALEALVDLHTEEYRELAKITKDVAAAGVLVLSAGTVVVFAALLAHNLDEIVRSGPQIARQSAAGLPLAFVVALLLRAKKERERPPRPEHLAPMDLRDSGDSGVPGAGPEALAPGTRLGLRLDPLELRKPLDPLDPQQGRALRDRPQILLRRQLQDHALFALGLLLWALLATWSVSSVFSALSAAVLFFAWRVARKLSKH